jgi:hypothetical protein
MGMRQKRRAANIRQLTQSVSRVEVFIEELALYGFSLTAGHAIGEALSAELERLFKEAKPLSTSVSETHLPLLDAGHVTLSPGANSVPVGQQVAQAVHGSLKKEGRGNRP